MSHRRARNQYGFGRLLFDFIMVFLTGGIWMIWLIVRYLRNNS